MEDASAAAVALERAGADELLLAWSAAYSESLRTLLANLSRVLSVPLLVRTVDESATAAEVRALLDAGAARVLISGPALRDPDLIAALSRSASSAALSVGVRAQPESAGWRVLGPGDQPTEWDVVTWARVVEAQGGAELLIEAPPAPTADEPFDLELLATVTEAVRIPVLAIGAAPAVEDVFDALMIGDVDGVVLDDSFRSVGQSLAAVKRYLAERGLAIRFE